MLTNRLQYKSRRDEFYINLHSSSCPTLFIFTDELLDVNATGPCLPFAWSQWCNRILSANGLSDRSAEINSKNNLVQITENGTCVYKRTSFTCEFHNSNLNTKQTMIYNIRCATLFLLNPYRTCVDIWAIRIKRISPVKIAIFHYYVYFKFVTVMFVAISQNFTKIERVVFELCAKVCE